ncbi:MAG: sigma-54 dependent transcriptional regulator [Planctomycetota bacterium]
MRDTASENETQQLSGAPGLDILLAEDEGSIRLTLADDLRAAGYGVTAVEVGSEALRLVEERPFDIVITDIRLPEVDGHAILRRAKELRPATEVIVITGFGTIEAAVEMMRAGAYHFIVKPFLNEEIVGHVARIARLRYLEASNAQLQEKLGRFKGFENIIGTSRPMQEVLRTVRTVAKSDATVLIEGESGTGKEVIARAIHLNSPRGERPFVALSCAALPESLIEAELFGHEKGAFTDARKERRGRFEQAHGGTLFLDDIDDLALTVQVKLLRAIQEREIERVGGEETIPVDIRLVAAAKRNLEEFMLEGKFREDLFYRLSVVNLRLPPLRERCEDIPLLIQHFIKIHGAGRHYEVKPQVLEALLEHPWPGNVRELENAVERSIALAGESAELRKEHLLRPSRDFRGATQISSRMKTLKETVEDAEKAHIRRVLRSTRGHRAQAAAILGISRKNLWEKLRDYSIDV